MKFLKLILASSLMMTQVMALAHTMTPAQRKEKIELYEKMSERYKVAAECLKSGKGMDECNGEAMEGCPMMGKNCPFMEQGHMDKEMMREHMKKAKESKPKSSP